MISRLVGALVVILEAVANFVATKKEQRMESKEGNQIEAGGGEVGVPHNEEVSPFNSHVPWCYVCRQGLGDEHDHTDQLCVDGV